MVSEALRFEGIVDVTNDFSIFVSMRRMYSEIQYAIVDIETTGGHAAGNGITEIAILVHNGSEVVEQFESLINPQYPIPLSIQALTGITDQMVADSPTFTDLAPQIYKLLCDRVFVAHNVNFDYSFVRHHLEAAGYRYTAPKLCTMRMSRQIRPGLRSYSLGRLCDALGIPIVDRHRAGGDARATAVLFTQLLTWDTAGVATEMLKKTSKHQQLPPNLPREDVDALPNGPGVYYFRDRMGKVVYVGKARDIRNRVLQHFTGHNPHPQRQHFLRDIYSVSYEKTGTELMALLLEAAEIHRLWPAYNRALKRFEPKYALYVYEDQNGYLRLAVGKHSRQQQHVQLFNKQLDAVNLLRKLLTTFELHPERCGFGTSYRPSSVMVPSIGADCTDADAGPAAYNQRVQRALDHLQQYLPGFAILDRGRNDDEQSCIWVEEGQLYGMGYISRHGDMNTPDAVKESLTRYSSNHYMMQLIYDYAAKYPQKVWTPGKSGSTFFLALP